MRVSSVAPSNSTPRKGIPALVLGNGACPPLWPPAAGGVGVTVAVDAAPPPITALSVAVGLSGAVVAVAVAVNPTVAVAVGLRTGVSVAVAVTTCCAPTTSTVLIFEKTGRLKPL